MDAVPIGGFEWVRKGNTGQLIPLSFELGRLASFLQQRCQAVYAVASMPCSVWLGMPRVLPWSAKQIMKVLWAVVDAVFRIKLNLAHRPIPHTCQVPEPVIELAVLVVVESELELTLNHVTTVSAVRCIA